MGRRKKRRMKRRKRGVRAQGKRRNGRLGSLSWDLASWSYRLAVQL